MTWFHRPEQLRIFQLQAISVLVVLFLMPVWAIVGSDEHFLFRAVQDGLFYIIELPPATFLASDLLLCFMTCLGAVLIAALAAVRVAARNDRVVAPVQTCRPDWRRRSE
jgi:hypothetical protein